MHRRTIINVAVIAAVAGSLAGQSFAAAKPKGFKKSFEYVDATPDVTATAGDAAGCDGAVPQFAEPPVEVTVPAKGTLKVALTSTGDWALDVRDSKGRVLGGADGGTPEAQESVTVKLKAAGKYLIYPCNIGGAPNATGTYEYKP